jgi:Tfp pilus assembly protein PilF
MDPIAAQAVIEQFVALGYIQPQTEDQGKAVAGAVRENPKEMRFRLQLAQCYLSLGRNRDARATIDEVRAFEPKMTARKRQRAKRSLAFPAPVQGPTGCWVPSTWRRAGPMKLWHRYSARSRGEPHLPNLYLRIGETYLRCKRIEDAGRAFQRALEIDGDSPEAHVGLAMVYLRQRRHEEAAAEALTAVGLQHFSPLGHFNLGVALARLRYRERALLAFESPSPCFRVSQPRTAGWAFSMANRAETRSKRPATVIFTTNCVSEGKKQIVPVSKKPSGECNAITSHDLAKAT